MRCRSSRSSFPTYTSTWCGQANRAAALVDVLRRMAAHFQQFAEVQSKFMSAMIYPALVTAVGALMISFFMFFMLPRFMEMFKGFDVELPLPTQILMNFSDAVTSFWWLIVLGRDGDLHLDRQIPEERNRQPEDR